MRLCRNILSLLTITLVITSVTAQTKTDFSGRWTSEPETANATQGGGGGNQPPAARIGDFGSGWGANLTITQNGRLLTVECPVFSRYDMQPPLKFVYALDGAETRNSVMMGRGVQAQTSRTEWDGNKLVIATEHTFANPTDGLPTKVYVKQKLWLESATSLVVETTTGGVLGGPLSTTRTVYRKLTARPAGT